MAKLAFFSFVQSQWTTVPHVEPVDLSGKTIIVVGANTGLGFEASQQLARMSPGRLILACRNIEKGKDALNRLQANTGCRTAELWQVDLGSFASVLAFAEKFEKDGDRLDILVCNAAVATFEYKASTEGWESTIQVNHLSTALLSLLLLPRLVETAKQHKTNSRLEIVSSENHFWTAFDEKATTSEKVLATLGSEDYCTPQVMRRRYPDSKLLNVFFTRALDSHVPLITPLTVLTVSPGFCLSELRRNLPFMMRIISWFMETLLARSTANGGKQLVFGAIGGKEEEESLRGAYLNNMAVHEPSDYVLQESALQDRLWEETLEILSKVSPKVRIVVDQYLA